VVVLAGTVVNLATRVTALYLDRRVADRVAGAQALLQVADDVLGVRKRDVVDDDVHAQRVGL